MREILPGTAEQIKHTNFYCVLPYIVMRGMHRPQHSIKLIEDYMTYVCFTDSVDDLITNMQSKYIKA